MAHYAAVDAQNDSPPPASHATGSVSETESTRHVPTDQHNYGYEYGYGNGQGHQYLPVYSMTGNADPHANAGYVHATAPSPNTTVSPQTEQYQQFGVENSTYSSPQSQIHHDHSIIQEYPMGQDYTSPKEYPVGQEYAYAKDNHYVYPTREVAPSSANTDTNRRRLVLLHHLWLWEILASIFSLACVGSVIGVLSYEQGKPLDQWQHGWGQQISPTAVVSFLGTMGKSACLLAVAEIISQLKWIHFNAGPQKLRDLEIFDNASRGPWGALQLVVLKNRTTLLAGCASLLVLAALFVDPFLQLVFTFPQSLTPVEGSSPAIRATQVYDPSALVSRFTQCYGAAQVDSVLQAAILSPVWNATRAPSLPCNFERCEWPSITTLGVCSSCTDFTDKVVPKCTVSSQSIPQAQCNYTLDANTTLSADFAVFGGAAEMTPYHTLWHSQVNTTSPAQGQDALITQYSFISLPDISDWTTLVDFNTKPWKLTSTPPINKAMQCSFSLCARTFETPYFANFTNGPLTGPSTPLNIASNPRPLENDIVRVTLEPATSDHPPMNTTFAINECDFQDLNTYLQSLFNVQYWSEGMTRGPNQNSSSSTSNSPLITPNIGLALSETGDIPDLMRQIADSMTEALRTSVNSTVVTGVGMNTVTYIAITWAWLALPIALVVLTFLMLLLVIFRNGARGVPIWKSSSLALLFHDLQGWDESERQAGHPHEVQRRGIQMKAQVVNEGGQMSFYRAG
ncbi:uncharacterized protein F4822DRAFT_421166 [Hypoxylon trugodes]|uniref:uncharacterized protein n=1 Tax=Hypoxylon trugodes TaxID=326681 RepID=UPI0021A0C8C9|nr:uncharacterized protein F4822DRAFT_421166 [Hypoxylon trugodes]KAI1383618.1 hypothetical protein F4822DRAFT_421166 [Hypoxylon trugodes]